jgi:thioesterase domain-containing protein/acyl carrier protein
MRKRLECGELDGYVKDIADVTLRQIGPFVAPEGRLERDLGAVFAQILRVDPRTVSTTTSFFDLGGTSLDILKFTQALERRFGFKTGLPVVLRNPTVRELASHISSGGEQRDRIYDPIVPLQVTGRKTPIFCVHPGNGEVFVLVNLAKYFLNDRPFYALRPRGFNENEEPFKTVEEMVDTYVSAILKRQPHGPYAIAGYSLGCEIAFEVAKRLEALGRSVGFLGCIDAAPRYQVSELEFNMATGLAMVIDLITLPQFSELNKTLSPTRPNDEVCEYILRFASPDRMAELDLDLHKFAVWARVAHSLETMLFGHLSAGTVQSMTVFCSEGISSRYVTVQWSREAWRKELQHWDDFVVRSKYIDIPGHHHTLMGPKHVAIFQSILRAEIDLAMEEH